MAYIDSVWPIIAKSDKLWPSLPQLLVLINISTECQVWQCMAH
jgi:hypothetical protein